MRQISLPLLSGLMSGLMTSFGCAPAEPGTQRLDDRTSAVEAPALAVAPGGRAVAVWRQQGGAGTAVMARVRDDGDWAAALPLDSGPGVGSARVVVSAAGRFVATWPRITARDLAKPCVRRLDRDHWSRAEILDLEDDGQATDPRAALDAGGRAQLVWERPHDGSASIAGGLLDGDAWSGGRLLERDDRGDAYEPQVVADGSGGFRVAWYQNDGRKYNVMSARCGVDGVCAAAEVLGASPRGDAFAPRLAAAGGTLALTWTQIDGERTAVWVRTFRADRWSDAHRLSAQEAGAPWPAVGADGSVWVVWQEGARITGARADSGAWRPADVPSRHGDGTQTSPVVALDQEGRAAVAWYESDGARVQLMLATWSGGWSAPRPLGAPHAAGNVDPDEPRDELPRPGMGVAGGWVHLVWSPGPTAGIWAAREPISGGSS